jgi:integrase/DNA-binding transcriptional regulator YhcF (GntR family)
MTSRKTGRKRRERGEIEQLPSGSLRVKVYAGVDALTGRRNYRTATVPSGPAAEAEAERVKTRLLNEVDEQRTPKTKATVDRLMARYMETIDVDVSTKIGYERNIRNHISPLLGKLQVGKLDGETFDSFYKVLRTCRAHCGGKKYVEHRTERPHKCDDRCGQHECKGLSTSSIRQIHWILSGSLKAAKRWKWITVNPLDQAKAPKAPVPKPDPPKAEDAAAIVNAAFRDPAWGMFVWLAMTSGARRGELCALTFDDLELDNAVISIRNSIGQEGGNTWEKGTKTHQQRRIALDEETVALLQAYEQRSQALVKELGVKLAPNARLFSNAVDHSTHLKPDSVSQRYRRMCTKLGITSHLHQLRHYSATELILSGVDVRTVAGRLGHGGGGATTLRVYTAWISEADQRAAGNLGGRMPTAPITVQPDATTTTSAEPEIRGPYQQIAADLRGAILCGALAPGTPVPTVVELSSRYGVSVGTAHRAVAELKSAGLVTVSRGKRAIVTSLEESSHANVVSLNAKRARS